MPRVEASLSTTRARGLFDRLRPRTTAAAWFWCGGVLVLASLFGWLSLHDVSGVTQWPDGTCCHTEFVDPGWSLAPTLLAIPIFAIAYSRRLVPLVVAMLGASVSVLAIAYVAVTRTENAGWGDGLEAISYLESFVQIAVFSGAIAWGWTSARPARTPPA